MFKRLISKLIKLFRQQNEEINTIYFSLFLILVIGMSLAHFFFWKTPLTPIPLFFIFHALGQCFLEAGFLLFLGLILNRWMPRWLFHAFIGFSFAVLLIHFADFTIVRLMDTSFSYIFKYFFGSGVSHLVPAFQALNMNLTMTIIVFASFLLIPLLGIFIYRTTQPLSKKMGLRITFLPLMFTLLAIGCSLYTLDLFFHPFLNATSYQKYQKALPLGKTFLLPKSNTTPLPRSVAKARKEETIHKKLASKKLLAAARPNIYLLIIETLRKDFVTPEIAPNLSSFGQSNLTFPESFANANWTNCSWFSIFHSDFPFHWTAMRDQWKGGSIPLRILKEFGYQIRVYSSADLRYFQMDELLFGENRALTDHIQEYTQNRLLEPCDRDELGMTSLLSDLEKEELQEGNVFILFLDSTHSEYSFPNNLPLKFEPIAKEIDYLTLTPQSVPPLINRYRNAIFYIDSLVGRFFEKLKEKELYQEAIIAITGDHGEEFFEEGAIFHGTHLNRYQTSVPLMYKFQNNPWVPLDTCSTHLDIFPSILHYLTGRIDFADLFDGESVFSPYRRAHRIAVLQNGSATPLEFTLENEKERHRFRFTNPQNIYESKVLEILSQGPFESAVLESILE